MQDIVLLDSDPTVWAKCPKCTESYPGKKVNDARFAYFATAYPRKKRGRSAADVLRDKVCENCGTPMQFMYEVKT